MKQALLFVLLASLALPVLADDPPPPPEEYLQLNRWLYRTDAIPVPAGGLRWEKEGASWTLDSGKIWLAEPAANGVVTGLVFEGKGRFRMAVPDPIELAQLRRFTGKPELQEIDEPFSALVLRTSGELPVALPPATGAFKENKLARERHEHWLTQWLYDVDARIVAAFHTPGDLLLRIDTRTDRLGWLAFDDDARRMEEIRLESFNTGYKYPETWLSLDRQADRSPDGRPSGRRNPEMDIQNADIVADVTEAGRDEDFFKGRFQVDLRFAGERPGATAVMLNLNPFAKLTAVTEDGQPVPFIRDHIGDRKSIIDKRVYDDNLVVLLGKPITAGEARTLRFVYELDLTNYVHSRGWYPDWESDETFLTDPHTARIELTARKKHTLRAMGRQEQSDPLPDGRSHGVWVVDHPVKMVTFSFAEKFHEETAKVEGAPEVLCFGSKVEVSRKARFGEVARDVAKSLAYFGTLFEAPLPAEPPLYVTTIAARHGQSFDGFIHLPEQSFDLLGPGLAELFRAHEVAHQWWGHRVGAATYRDAWLGEAFAEYSAMLYVRDTVPDGPKLFNEILRTYNDEQNGSIKSGFSKFARFDVNLANRAHGDRIGPIGHSWRANTGQVPTAYSSIVYGKGALVLYMLDRLLTQETGSDKAFLDVLRDFLKANQGKVVSTADFAAAVARRAPGDWSWFFDQWVERAEVPTYRWSASTSGNVVTVKVSQTDVPEGFRMPVPVRVELDGAGPVEKTVLVDGAQKSFELKFDAKPKSVVFNPDYAVLAKVKRD
ncbi:MAG: M1 family aminopeptidase [Acidobacteriota bacterium]